MTLGKKFGLICLILLVVSIGVIGVTIVPYYTFLTQTLKISPLTLLMPSKTIETVDEQVNILVLGIAGGTHDGPNLSDSLTVLHYNFSTNIITTLGVPRDMWSDTLKTKINAAYALGEAKQKGGGIKVAKAEVGALLGIPIEYAIVIDFQSFEQVIDYMGGIDVAIEHSFTDNDYPIAGRENDLCSGDLEYRCRYQTIHFDKGVTHMNGETALIFTRSRHAEGEEGSDFARSKRQQLVITALKEKIMRVVKTKDTAQYTKLYTQLNSLVERDITNQELADIGKNSILKKNLIQKHVGISEQSLFVPSYDLYEGQYVLVPQNTNYTHFHEYIQCLITKGSEDACASYITEETKQ